MDEEVRRFLEEVERESEELLTGLEGGTPEASAEETPSPTSPAPAGGAATPPPTPPVPPTTPTPTAPAGGTATPSPPTPPAPPTPPTPPPPALDVDSVVGISSAYGINPEGIKPAVEKPKKNSEPPKREKNKSSSGKDKDIMAVFWDMILDCYGWCIDKMVDIPLDFLEWVIYAKAEEEKGAKGDSILDLAEKETKNLSSGIDKITEQAKQVHSDIKRNVSLIAEGEAGNWSRIASIKPDKLNEIKRYTEDVLVPSYREYLIDPNSPGATAYANFEKFPEVLDRSSRKIKGIGAMANTLAALDILSDKDVDIMPESYTSKYIELKEKMSERTIDYAEVRRITEELIDIVPGDEAFAIIKDNLEQIKNKTSTSDKNGIFECMENINKETSDEGNKARIAQLGIRSRSSVYMGKILSNLDKIYEECGTDVDRRNETMSNYLKHINEKIKSVAETATQADKEVRSDIAVSEKKRNKMAEATASVDNFEFDGRPISAHATSIRNSENIFANPDVIYGYMVGRV